MSENKTPYTTAGTPETQTPQPQAKMSLYLAMPTGRATAPPNEKIPCEVYSRIVGYLRPTQAWNKAKLKEFNERKIFKPSAVFKDERSRVGVATATPSG